MIKYEIWKGEGEFALLREDCKDKGKMTLKLNKVHEFEAGSWVAACQRYHEYFGWEPYEPLQD